MPTNNIFTYVTWIANDGSPDSMGSLTVPLQITSSTGTVVDQAVELKTGVSTILYDGTAPKSDPDWTWMIFWAESDVKVVYIGTADTDSSALQIKAGTVTCLVSNQTMDYDVDDQIRLVAVTTGITKLWARQTTGVDYSIRFVFGS